LPAGTRSPQRWNGRWRSSSDIQMCCKMRKKCSLDSLETRGARGRHFDAAIPASDCEGHFPIAPGDAAVHPQGVSGKKIEVCRYKIPAGTRLTLNVFAIHRDPTVYNKPQRLCAGRVFATPRGHGHNRQCVLRVGAVRCGPNNVSRLCSGEYDGSPYTGPHSPWLRVVDASL
jgi:hypothetical protein